MTKSKIPMSKQAQMPQLKADQSASGAIRLRQMHTGLAEKDTPRGRASRYLSSRAKSRDPSIPVAGGPPYAQGSGGAKRDDDASIGVSTQNVNDKHSKKTVVRRKGNYAFIDSQNLNLGVRSQGWNLSFERFRRYLKDKYHVTRAYLFIGYIPENQGMYASLQKNGYIVVFKPTLVYKHKTKGVVKGNVDAELVLHAMIEYPRYHKAVVVSGDGDFHCLIEHLADTQKLEKIVVPNRYYSSLLRKYSSYIVNIGILKSKLAYESPISSTDDKNEAKEWVKKPIARVGQPQRSRNRRQKN